MRKMLSKANRSASARAARETLTSSRSGRQERSVSEAVEATTYSQLKKAVERLEGASRTGVPMGELTYLLVDIALRAGFLLGRAYEHAGLKGAERVQSGVGAIDALFQRVRVVERRVLSSLGSKSQGAIRSVRSLGPQPMRTMPSTKPSVLESGLNQKNKS